jgi:hypothetical protein
VAQNHSLLCRRTVSTALGKACNALKRDLDVSKITEGLPDILAITNTALKAVEEAALDKLGAVRVERAIGCLPALWLPGTDGDFSLSTAQKCPTDILCRQPRLFRPRFSNTVRSGWETRFQIVAIAGAVAC